MYRHGDVTLIVVRDLPKSAVHCKSSVLAEGEVTGHAHTVVNGEVFELAGLKYLQANKGCTISHEEHGTKQVEPGVYIVPIKRQYDAENGWERVVD